MKIYTFVCSLLFCFFGIQLIAQPAGAEKGVFITNEATINSDGLEYSPAFLENGIVFISTRTANRRYKVKDKRINQNIMSIYRATREDNGLLSKPKPFALELLSTVHEGPVTFDRTAEKLFFTRNNIKNGKKKRSKDGIVKLKIYTADKVGDEWKNIEELPFNDDDSNAAHPSVSVEGDALYFASDRPGGFGGMDIWVAYQKGGIWSEPENLGAAVNTESDEVFPFIHADGTLYFASTGHSGFGGLDLFTAQQKAGTWSTPVNLDLPFNSEQDDFGFIIDRDKKNGYFSSNRPGGLGGDDIYSFYVFEGLDKELGTELAENMEPKKLAILVSDFSTGAMIDSANVSYTNLNNLAFSNAINAISNDEVNNNEILLRLPLQENNASGYTDSWGKYPLELTPGNYAIIVEKEGFQPQQLVINTSSDESEIFISLEKVKAASQDGSDPGVASTGGNTRNDNRNSNNSDEEIGFDESNPNRGSNNNNEAGFPSTIKEGTVFQLPNIYYNFNDSSIRPDAKIDLDALATFLLNYPDIEIELSSHTDSRGGTRYNRRLSQNRAENAVNYLAAKGVERSRLKPVGYGEGQLRNRCSDGVDCTEIEHQYNRRTEVKILKMSEEINIRFVRDDSMPEKVDYSYNDGADYNSRNAGTNSGDFKVVAGVFRNLTNAKSRTGALQNLGYDAQIVSSASASTHTVVVGNYLSLEEAQVVVRTLKGNNIRSFVKR